MHLCIQCPKKKKVKLKAMDYLKHFDFDKNKKIGFLKNLLKTITLILLKNNNTKYN